MKLVIVESPAKIKSIKSYLGKGYDVVASKGHVVDLPKSDLGVDVLKNYKPKYVISKLKSIQELKKAFETMDGLVIATDPDREGEAIGWHVANKLGVITDGGKIKPGKKVERIIFTSITKNAVQDAIKHPREIDFNLFNAQQARRVLDRLVGYKLSPLLWKKIRFGLSAGRVQSVAVRLVVEREEEREKFKTEEYWSVKAGVQKSDPKGGVEVELVKGDVVEEILDVGAQAANSRMTKLPGIVFELQKIGGKKANVTSEKQASEVITAVKDKEWKVTDIVSSKSKRYPKPPFTTSTLQQTAARMLGFSAKRTMSVAQKLYEAGLITYMRTDSTNLTPDAVDGARKIAVKFFGDSYIPEKPIFYKTQSKVAQEAHEAIRPAHFEKAPKSLSLEADQQRLYTLVWQRAVASQMVPAEVEKGRVEILVEKYLFTASGQKMLFSGYLKVYPEKFEEQDLPELVVGEQVFPKKMLGRQHFTQPPARYSEATLIKALEFYGIGRPSTYVPTLTTIQSRQYVEREGKYFKPTDIGRVVNKLLMEHFRNIVSYKFTAEMENNLDDIANGDKDWVKVMDDFYKPFDKALSAKDKEIDRENYTVLGDAPKDVKCPDCGGKMNVKLGRYGRFYSCQKWPECKGMLGEDGKSEGDRDEEMEKEKESAAFKQLYKNAPKTEKGDDYLLKMGRFGKFWAHPDYPKVKDAKPLEFTDEIRMKIYGKPPKSKDGKTVMLLRRGKFGEFWAHPDYPEVKEVVRIDKKAVGEKKAELGVG